MRSISFICYTTTITLILLATSLTAYAQDHKGPSHENALASLNAFSDDAEGCIDVVMACVEELDNLNKADVVCRPELDYCLHSFEEKSSNTDSSERPKGPPGMDGSEKGGSRMKGPGAGGPGEGGPGMGGPPPRGSGMGGPGMGGSGERGPGMNDTDTESERERPERGSHERSRGVSAKAFNACLTQVQECAETNVGNTTCSDTMYTCIHTALEAEFDAMCERDLNTCEEIETEPNACTNLVSRCEDGVPYQRS